MTEEQDTYTLETFPRMTLEEVSEVVNVMASREIPRIDSLERRIKEQEHRLQDTESLFVKQMRRVDALQDANLAPLLEASAVLVELRRLADALEVLAEDVAYAPRSRNR